MNGNNRYPRTVFYIMVAIGVVVVGLLTYGLTHAITQASLALVAGLILVVGNAPDLLTLVQHRTSGLAMLNTLVGIALLSFFMAHWLGIVFYIPLVLSLLLALPLTLNRVAIARTYASFIKGLVLQLRHLVKLPGTANH